MTPLAAASDWAPDIGPLESATHEAIMELESILANLRKGLYTPEDFEASLLYAAANLRNKVVANARS